MASDPVKMNYPTTSDAQLSYENTLNVFSAIRRSLLRLVYDEDNSDALLTRACTVISVSLGCCATFLEGSINPNEYVGFTPFPVSNHTMPIGTLLIETAAIERDYSFNLGELEEIADLLGLCIVQARQSDELAELQNESEEMLYYAPDVIFVLSEDGVIKMANRKALDLVEQTEANVCGQQIQQILGPSSPQINHLIELSKIHGRFEVELSGIHGRRLASFAVSLTGDNNNSTQILMVGRDITTERQAELALRRNERATLMAQTIDYLLHEVNNPLAALISNVSTAAKRHREIRTLVTESGDGHNNTGAIINRLDKLDISLDGASRAGNRINEAMKMLRTANQKRTLTGPEQVDVSFELGLAISAMEQEFKHVAVARHLGALPKLAATPLHLAEVFGAVLRNAAQAVAENASPQISVTAGFHNGNVTVSIEDNGPGVNEHHQDQIFMPFFTTKPLGNAIGLGLSMAQDMVKRANGSIEVTKSSKLGGACFVITFPIEKPYQ